MTIARKYLIDYSKTCYYHCISRCVRQGYLLNSTGKTGKEPNYRHEWIQRRVLFLSEVFAIDLMSFAIMDNHTHLVLFANLKLAQQWSNVEVLRRCSKLGKLSILCQLYLRHDWRIRLNDVELAIALDQIDEYRRKLTDVSVFMSRLNYYVAKRANKEDKVKGHFWEARFKSQALLDSEAVLSCMQYVDLNPIRASKSTTLSDSHFTSIKYRMDNAQQYARVKMMPLRTYDCMNHFFGNFNLTLGDYIEGLKALISENHEIPLSGEESQNDSSWVKNTPILDHSLSICAGDSQLVAQFNKQAKLFRELT